MSLDDELKVERYKLVTDRQKYFTDLARESFAYYTRVFVWFAGGAVALISLKEKLAIGSEALPKLLNVMVILVTLIGIASSVQIVFCLKRWYGFRKTECEIYPSCPTPEWWACIFEGMYILAIVVSIFLAWRGVDYLQGLLQ